MAHPSKLGRAAAALCALAALCACGFSSTPAPTATAAATKLTSTALPGAAPAAPTDTPRQASPTLVPQATATRPAAPAEPAATLAFSYPIGAPGRPLGDGFFIRHGEQTENTWYNPGYWHTGEDWYAIAGDTAGAAVFAIAPGEVVYAGANYPGRVVIVRHAADLFSMYGHLDPRLSVRVGQRVERAQPIGTVLRRSDATPNHLHFEVRTFLTTSAVNGDRPRYRFSCGVNCPPGPGYWPIDAPDLPGDLGWRNPTHVVNRRMLVSGAVGAVVVATQPASDTVTLWSAPPGEGARQPLGELKLAPGARYSLIGVDAGPEDSRETSALAYRLWYRLRLPDGREGWAQVAVPSAFETGGDGRPSSVYFNFLPT